MKPVGKPDAGNPHVRFDERGGETGRLDAFEADTAPFLDSTVLGGERAQAEGGHQCRPANLQNPAPRMLVER